MLGDICSPLVGQAEKLKAFLKEYYSDPNYVHRDLAEEIQKRFVVGEADARKFVELLVGEVSDRTTVAKRNAPSLKQLFRSAPPGRKAVLDKLLDMSNAGAFDTDQYLQAAAKKLKVPVITTDFAAQIKQRADDLQKLDGDAREVAAAELLRDIEKLAPRKLGEKLKTLHTASMLLNAPTLLTNITSNALYGTVYKGVSNVVATAIDGAVGLITKQRSQTLPNAAEYGKGFVGGFQKGVRDAVKGIDTSPAATQYDLPKGKVFNGDGVLNKALGAVETALNISLKAVDRAFYEGTYRESLANQKAALKGREMTPELEAAIEKNAIAEALIATFQDKNKLSEISTGIKRQLNKAEIIPGFGWGEILHKYPKTPANILARSLVDMTPVGLVDATGKAVDGARKGAFNQRQFVQKTADALVGIGIAYGIAETMAEVGVLNGPPTGGSKERENDTAFGDWGFQINVDKFQRWAASGFQNKPLPDQKGDTKYEYSKLMPFAMPFMVGTMLAKNKGTKQYNTALDVASAAALGSMQSADAVTNQGMLRNIDILLTSRDPEGNPSLMQGFLNVTLDIPSSFVPSAVKRMNYLGSNVEKETRDANPFVERYNRFRETLPFVRDGLPTRYDLGGNPKERFATTDPLAKLLNPLIVKKVSSDPALQETRRIFTASQDSGALLPTVARKVDVIRNGKHVRVGLNAQQISDYTRMFGALNSKWVLKATKDDYFNELDPEHQARVLSGIYKGTHEAVKRALFKHEPNKPSRFGAALFEEDEDMAELYLLKMTSSAYKKQLGEEVTDESEDEAEE